MKHASHNFFLKSPGNSFWLKWLFALSLLIVFDTTLAAGGKLSNLVVQNLSPAFNSEVKQYTVPQPSNCAVPVTATLADTGLRLYIASTETASGATRSAWVCNGKTKIDIVVYKNWTEVDRYTITPMAQQTAPTPPPPPPVSGKLSNLVATGLSPAFDPAITQYTVPRPMNCSVPVTAGVDNPTNPNLKLYIASNPTTSGKTVNAWVCDGKTKVDVVIYDVWKEVGHYIITPVGEPVATTPPTTMPPSTTPPTSTPNPPMVAEANPVPEPAPALPVLPAPDSADRLTAIRFLEQAGFGPTPAEITAVQTVGLKYWMAQQANLPASGMADGLDRNQVVNQSFLNMYQGSDQLRQRMIFALSQIIVVSTNKNINGEELVPWVRLLSKHAFGNYRSLLRDVSLSPTMGKYLDLANSKKFTGSTSPNENYPRELMQLFTIGLAQLNQDGSLKLDAQNQPIPTYDQFTLREVARALTGWTYPTRPGATQGVSNWEYFTGLMEPRPQYHDTGAKILLNGKQIPAGQTVTQDLDAVLDNIFQHPNLPPFIATRLIRSLVTGNPSPGYIQRVADVFVNNGQSVRGDLWAVLNAILTDTEATGVPAVQQGHLRDPLLHIMQLGRALGAQITDPGMFMYIFRHLGQEVLSPTTVFSFYSPLSRIPKNPALYGPEFQIYSPALAIERANFIYQILSNQLGSSFSINLSAFNAVAGDTQALVEQVNQTLMQGRMSGELRQIIIKATNATSDTYNRVLGALYLAAISSEYSVQR